MTDIYNKVSATLIMPPVLTPSDVRAVLGLSKNTAYELFHKKNFPAFRVGKLYRIQREAFEKWMASAVEGQ